MTLSISMRSMPMLCCPQCGKKIFDGVVLTARVIRVGQQQSQAKCARCKAWVPVPVVLAPTTPARTVSR